MRPPMIKRCPQRDEVRQVRLSPEPTSPTAEPDAFEARGDLAQHPVVRPAFLSPKGFATVIGVSQNTVLRRIKDDAIHAVRIGRLWRIPVSEVGRLLG
jgi:excisionase family DNA binding protein